MKTFFQNVHIWRRFDENSWNQLEAVTNIPNFHMQKKALKNIEPLVSYSSLNSCFRVGGEVIWEVICPYPHSNFLFSQWYWTQNEQAIFSKLFYSSQVTHNDKDTWTLHIKDVKTKDAGQYMCQVILIKESKVWKKSKSFDWIF